VADAAEAIRKIEKIVDFWYQSGKLPEDALLNIRRVAREADVDPITEHATQMTGGGYHIRAGGIERVFPLDEWIKSEQKFGTVYRRRILEIEDWSEVPRG